VQLMARSGWDGVIVSETAGRQSAGGSVSLSRGMNWEKLQSDNLALRTGERRRVMRDDERVECGTAGAEY
jgi:hypothetical protein